MANKEVAYWEEQFKHCEQVRRPFEEQWYMNMAFYFGKQWVVWQKLGLNGARLNEPPPSKHRVRLVSNKCKKVVRNEVNKFTKEEPHFYVVPSTTEPEDISAARAGESIADYILHNSSYNSVRRRSAFWLSICGTSFMHSYCGGADQDITIQHIVPFHMYVPHIQEEELEKQPYVIYARAVPVDDFSAQYQAEGLNNDVVMDGGVLEQRFFNALGIKNGTNQTKANLMFTKEIWIKPCKQYPDGGLIVIANGRVVYHYTSQEETDQLNLFEGENGLTQVLDENTFSQTEYPFDHGMFPFAKQDHIPTGRFWAESSLVDFIPLQKEYNKTRSQMIEAKNLMIKPQLTYTKGSIDPKKVTSAPGLLIPVQPGYQPPTPLIMQITQGGDNELQYLTADMQEIGGNTDMSQGKVPPGIEAASAISYLQEENDSIISTTIASIEEATEIIGKQCLSLVQQFWSQGKITQVVSKNAAQEALIFKSAKLKDNTDIRIEAGSMAPKSRAARQAFITELMRGGFIPPEKGLRYLQMSETNTLYQELQVDTRQAQRENIKMARGEQTATHDYDNQEVHVYEHELYMKSQEFEMLEPLIQQLFITHDEEHKTRIMINGLPQPAGPIESGGDTDSDSTGEPVGVS